MEPNEGKIHKDKDSTDQTVNTEYKRFDGVLEPVSANLGDVWSVEVQERKQEVADNSHSDGILIAEKHNFKMTLWRPRRGPAGGSYSSHN